MSDGDDPAAGCALMRKGGFGIYRGLVDASTLDLLRVEADQALGRARESRVTEAVEAERGGVPCRKFLSAPGGPVQTALVTAPWRHALLAEIVGLAVRPTGGGTTTGRRRGQPGNLDLKTTF